MKDDNLTIHFLTKDLKVINFPFIPLALNPVVPYSGLTENGLALIHVALVSLGLSPVGS
jgi:hypothetical protein